MLLLWWNHLATPPEGISSGQADPQQLETVVLVLLLRLSPPAGGELDRVLLC